MQRENQQLRKTVEELKHSRQRIIELEAENEQLQKATLEGKTTVYSLTEVRHNSGQNLSSLFRDLLFSQKIIKRANENKSHGIRLRMQGGEGG